MKVKDKRLGMNRPIARRDFLSGVSVAIGASLLPSASSSGPFLAGPSSQCCPSQKLGMRGAHPGSFEVAHATVQGQEWKAQKTHEHYDLIIVGAGISGLSAAYIYTRDVDPKARILIIDNHDDFGGHAKRNEFTIDGKTFIGFGGTMLIENLKGYPAVSKQVINELGINVNDDSNYNHHDMLRNFGLGRGTFFDKETFGRDHLAVGSLISSDALDDAPLSASAKVELKRLLEDKQDYLEGMTPAERRAVIMSHTWRDYLSKFAKVGEEVLTYIQKRPHAVWSIGADAMPAMLAWNEGYPGFADMDLGEKEEDEEEGGNFRFPDGNASIARLLVRKLIPEIARGNTMDDIVSAKFDYEKLDQPESLTRIRLNSTAVNLKHLDGDLGANVEVTYVQGDKAKTVKGSKVIWAGYHAMLKHICPDVPDGQFDALSRSVRSPLVYTSVLIRNWQSLVKLGISGLYCPGSFFQSIRTTHLVSIGDYKFAQSPDEPVILHLQHIPLAPGLSAPDQFRAGRQTLLETSFETFERNVRDQLGRILGLGGFDPARDIQGITVNRWPHGYAYSVDPVSNDVAWSPEAWHHEKQPWVEARQRIGNIAIAGTDAASNAMTEAAIEEAYRAVHSFLD